MATETAQDLRREAFLRQREVALQNPADIGGLVDFCLTYGTDFPEDVVDLLEAVASGASSEPVIRLPVLGGLVRYRELLGRRGAGLSLSHCASVEDLSFRYALDALRTWQTELEAFVQRKPSSYSAILSLAEALMCGGDFAAAEIHLAKLRPAGAADTTAVTSFDANFHDGLAGALAGVTAVLAPLHWIRKPDPSARRMVFVAADLVYFRRYGMALVNSFHGQDRGDIGLALHIMDATHDEAEAIAAELDEMPDLRFCLSTEWSGLRRAEVTTAAKSYYHAVRFLRLLQIAREAPDLDLWLIDIDNIFIDTPRRLFALLAGHDVALHMLPLRLESRNRVAACWVGISHTSAGRNYLAGVAGYIAAWMMLGRLTWGIDQVALYAILMKQYATGGLSVAAISPDVLDAECSAGGVLRPSKTAPA